MARCGSRPRQKQWPSDAAAADHGIGEMETVGRPGALLGDRVGSVHRPIPVLPVRVAHCRGPIN